MGFELLLIEDNPGDVQLTKFAFRECGLDLTLHIATSGPEAVAFLKQQNQFSKDLNVALILMDWHLPLDTGAETLIAIRDLQRKLKLLPIPIIVFSSSLLLDDVRDAYAQGANCWINKGSNLDEFFEAIAGIIRFWFQTVCLPIASS